MYKRQLIGVGGAAISSIYLGQKDDLKATEVLHNVLILCILTGICFGGITYYFLDEILIFFGASTSTLPYARDFMQVLDVYKRQFLQFSHIALSCYYCPFLRFCFCLSP